MALIRPSPRRRHAVVAAVALLAVTACSGAGDEATSVDPAPAAAAPTTVARAPTTAAPTTTAAAPTTVAPTYTLPPATVPLPQPEPAPLDDEASEPVVPLGSVAIPAIGIDRPLFEGIRLPTFDLGPGHWPGTAMPGQVGNMVIGGHRTEGHADFRDIDRLQPGDEVVVTDAAGTRFAYRVDGVEIADPFAARIVYQSPASTATLFACHPPGSVDQRVVVHLTLVA